MMNIKSILLGALVFFLVSVALAFVLAIPDEALFEEIYKALPLWRGELESNSSLFLAWIAQKMIFALGISLLFHWVSPSMKGPGWRRGILFGLCTCPLIWATYLGLWTLFTLPASIWIWWGSYYLILVTISGAAMGSAVEIFTYKIIKKLRSSEL